jgi:hypothetical protein
MVWFSLIEKKKIWDPDRIAGLEDAGKRKKNLLHILGSLRCSSPFSISINLSITLLS